MQGPSKLRINFAADGQPFGQPPVVDQTEHVVDYRGEFEIALGQLHLAGFDFRKIENVVDHVEQTLTGAIERIQTGIRMEKRLLKVLKALAEYYDISPGDLLEGIVLHAFDGKCAFEQEALARIADLKRIYNLDLDASASHNLQEINLSTPEEK